MREYVAEFMGSLFFIYVILSTGNALAIGATLALVCLLTSPISGGHINPAVTIVLAASGKFPTQKVIPYNFAQICGGLVSLEIFKRYRP